MKIGFLKMKESLASSVVNTKIGGCILSSFFHLSLKKVHNFGSPLGGAFIIIMQKLKSQNIILAVMPEGETV